MRYLQHDKLDRYLTTYASAVVINKAKNVVRWGKFNFSEMQLDEGGKAKFRVRSEQYSNIHYEVIIQNFLGPGAIDCSCSCPYSKRYSGACEHIVAMMMILDQHEALAQPAVQYQMLDCTVHLPDLSDSSLRQKTSDLFWNGRGGQRSVEILSAFNGVAACRVFMHDKSDFTVRFTRISLGEIHTSCSCAETQFDPICAHKLAALLSLRDQYGILAFEVMRDWSIEKNRLLAEFGFTTADNLTGKFEFKINNQGQMEMTVLDASIQSPDQLGNWWKSQEKRFAVKHQVLSVPKPPEEAETNRILLYAFTLLDNQSLPDVVLTPLSGKYLTDKEKLSHISKLDAPLASNPSTQVEIPPITELDSKAMALARSGFGINALLASLREAGFPMTRWYYQNMPLHELSEEMRQSALMHLGRIWDQLIPLLHDRITVVSPDQNFHLNSLSRVFLQSQTAKPFFQLYEENDFAILQAYIHVGEEIVALQKCQFVGFWFLRYKDKLIKIARYNDGAVIQQMGPTGQFKVKSNYLPDLLKDFVLPLTAYYSVDFNIEMDVELRNLVYLDNRIYLKEDERNLLFIPTYAYRSPDVEVAEQEIEFLHDGKHDRIAYNEGKMVVWNRDQDAEQAFNQFMENLHPDFKYQNGQEFYYLPFDQALKEQWLFRFFEAAQAQNIPIFGFNQLKKFRYNPNRPSFKIRASSGIDWFDMRMEVMFGEQTVTLAEIKKAVLNKQHYIQLNDGSLGMLPEEWLEKYAGLFKFGQIKGDEIKVSKLHFSIIDDLFDQIDDEVLQQEIWEKKQKLLHFKTIEDVPQPANVKANLRDYQKEGFKWLNFLDEFKWGGCLADDMGLGKTVQILCFLQHRKNINPKAVNLIVVPTTLIFNWQAEVEKFTPELKIYIHRGVARERDLSVLRAYDLVLTTYGTLRSDIETFRTIQFDYVVLDESQAIKNPDSKIAKAVKLLSTKNRLVMTGTPVENNTFDLYSQMEFLNPGLLGSQEFFRSEFATPIDKYRDEEKARQLRKLIYPFMLKRTKEEVAKDLPDKMEMILFCEMGVQQRKVYDDFRELYRARIVEKMAEEGKDKAAFLILEGLLKLRQICDSPALLSGNEDFGNDSAKLEEIIREIEENAGNHKILIFSQFLKMLDLIRQHLEKSGIPYEYLDGSTQDRAARVRNFQESVNCRVFLMSLKAGGVGINLTEADYVYLVDPWWNPAVEQQAIDRTHRIGQTKKVFAYKMICKDTVEEKILQLQEKKKDIAKDLISTEQGLIKKLTQDDIVGLFS
jgi:non-specific serine/threonine protein kinase